MNKDTLILPSDQDITGRNLGKEELALLSEVIHSGVLNSTKGSKTAQFEKDFAALYGSPYCVAIASGTAAVHAAVAALNLEPQSEIITTPITDMGALTPIIYEGCVPVFADVDPYSYNVTAATIQKKITPKTKAIIVTHLFGYPCEMGEIMALAKKNNLVVIEDCAQSYLAKDQGKRVGNIGDIGVFSMQQGKHITTGEGGMLLTANADYARRIRLFVNKAWGYGDPSPDHYFLAINYRLTELQSAVGLAQIKKLEYSVTQRRKMAVRLDARLANIRGIRIPKTHAGAEHVYWKYCLDVDADVAGFNVMELAGKLKAHGIASAPRYIQKPAFRCQIFKDGVTFGKSHWPFSDDQLRVWQDENECRKEYPGAYQALSRVLVLPWNEFYTEKHVDYIADKLEQSIAELSPAHKA